jgi:hypothetical protein
MYLWLYSPSVRSWLLFQFLNPIHIVGKTPWTGDQSVARPLPKHRITQTEKMHINIHALIGNRTHDLSVRATEDS